MLLKKFLDMHGGSETDATSRAAVRKQVDASWNDIEKRVGDGVKPDLKRAVEASILSYQHPTRTADESPVDYQRRVDDYNSWQGDLTNFLKSHKDSPVIQQAVKDMHASKEWRDSMKAPPLRPRQVGQTKEEWQAYKEDHLWHVQRRKIAREALKDFSN